MLTKTYHATYVRITLAIALLIAVFAASPARAVTSIRYVKWNAGGANNGTSWANAYKDLQSALAAAPSGSEIWVAAGTYKPTSGTDRTVSFSLKNGVKVYGGFAGTETLLSQRNPAANVTILSADIGVAGNVSDNSYHVVSNVNVNNTALLDGFTIRDGYAENWQINNDLYDRGGGMYNYASSPVLVNLIFTDNYVADFGGGMYNDQSHPSLTNVTFTNNVSDYMGGGMYSEAQSSPSLTNVTFSDNTAYSGGGMANLGHSNPSLTNVTFAYNIADNHGGGMINTYGSSPTLNKVTFVGNTAAKQGGGMSNSQSNPSLVNVTFSGNIADTYGGGMYNQDSSPVLTDVVFSSNEASSGGGMANKNSSPVLNRLTFSQNMA